MDIDKAHKLAVSLMAKHGLFQQGWEFKFGSAQRQFGSAQWNHAKGYKRITVSRPLTLINTEAEVRDTILHEIAHALAGAAAGHGYEWQRTCRKIGANPNRLMTYVTPEKPYKGTCPNPKCDRVIRAFRRTNIACGRCCKRFNRGQYSAEYKITWTDTRVAA